MKLVGGYDGTKYGTNSLWHSGEWRPDTLGKISTRFISMAKLDVVLCKRPFQGSCLKINGRGKWQSYLA